MLHGCVIAKVQIKIHVILWNCFKPSLENHTFCYRCNVLRNFSKLVSLGLFTIRFLNVYITRCVRDFNKEPQLSNQGSSEAQFRAWSSGLTS